MFLSIKINIFVNISTTVNKAHHVDLKCYLSDLKCQNVEEKNDLFQINF